MNGRVDEPPLPLEPPRLPPPSPLPKPPPPLPASATTAACDAEHDQQHRAEQPRIASHGRSLPLAKSNGQCLPPAAVVDARLYGELAGKGRGGMSGVGAGLISRRWCHCHLRARRDRVSTDAYTAALAGRSKRYVLHLHGRVRLIFRSHLYVLLDAQRENSWLLLHTKNSMPFPRALTRA
jgi:hypothetical protein